MIRVALIITDLDVGGAERALVALATRLDRQRFSPVVYCLSQRPPQGGDACVAQLESAGIEVHFYGAKRIRSLASALVWLQRHLRRQTPLVVQTFLFHANILGRIAARWAGRPAVVSGIRVAQRGKAWRLWLDRWTDAWVDRHVCVSQAVARFSTTAGRLPEQKLVVIPNGIDVNRYPGSPPADLSRLGMPAGRSAVTFVGRLDEQKGVDWLLDTAPRWLKQLPDIDLLLVGKGPAERHLRDQTTRRCISDRVHFAGWQADVPAILAASRLLILPSRWEGMPNAVLEAMASRLPVLATDVEGVRELLGPAAESQTIAYGDSESLAAKLVALASDPQLAERLGVENRHRAEAEFTIDTQVRCYADLWESLI